MNMPLNIDWQQILLHLLNFVILAGGLYFILYKPVKSFMEKREAHYKEMDSEAQNKLAEAEKLNASYAEKLKTAEADIRKEKSKASEEISKAREESLAEAEKKAEKIISDAQNKAEEMKTKYMEEAKQEINLLAEEAAEKIIMDKKQNALDEFLNIAEAGEKVEHD